MKILTISSVFNLLQPRLLASMLQSAVTAPCTMCTRDEYSGKSSCKIVTRVYCRCSVASRHEKSLPPLASPYSTCPVASGMFTWTTTLFGKSLDQPGIKWKLNVFVSRACQRAPSSRVNLFLFDLYLCNRVYLNFVNEGNHALSEKNAKDNWINMIIFQAKNF